MTKLIRPKPGRNAESIRAPENSADLRPYPFLLPPVEADEIGRLGSYRVLSLLGRGGMGLVFRAEDTTLRRAVALKIMKPDLDGSVRGSDRFLREARVMAAIKHDALVPVFQAGEENGIVYLAMELLQGMTLEDWCQRRIRADVKEVFRLGKEIAAGLCAIHAHDLVHRDLKPSNLWLQSPGDRIKILDFGLARFVHDDAGITQTGNVVGTPAFMSPEQARGETVDARSDLFSLGCVLYTLCAGVDPFHADTTAATLTAIVTKEPRPVRDLNPAVPRSLSNLIAKLLSKSPDDRPSSAAAVLERLERIEARTLGSGATAVSMTAPVASIKHPPAGGGFSSRRTARLSTAPRRRKVRTGRFRRWSRTGIWGAVVAGCAAIGAGACLLLVRPAAKDADQPAVFLSGLQPVRSQNWPFLPPPPPGLPPLSPIGRVFVGGKNSPHGIFMHPPPAHQGGASLSYSLGKKYTRFLAEASMNDGPGRSEFPFEFSVCGDGRLLWQSQPLTSQAETQTCSVALEGVDVLTLGVISRGEPRGAHAVWVEPRLEN